MKIARRSIHSPFLLEKSKLTRLLELTDAKLSQDGHHHERKFTARAEEDRVTETDSLEVVLALDNSARHRIKQLHITSNAYPQNRRPDEAPDRQLSIEFDGRSQPEIEIVAQGQDATWVNEAFSIAEEQAERTLQSSLINRMASAPLGDKALIVLFFAFFLGIAAITSTSGTSTAQLSQTMWLTPQDLKDLEPIESNPSPSQTKQAEILSRQLRNLRESARHEFSPLKLLNRRDLLIATPLLIILASLAYLSLRCYPPAVFLWGDAEDWYRSILAQRKFIWSAVVVTLVLGVVLDFFALAIATH